MADEIQEQQAVDGPQGEPEAKETDWKAEARKWEARAKKSANAELELEALKQEQMTEQEKARARAEKAESELAAIKAEAQRMADVREVSAASGVPASLLEYCSDREAMEGFVKDYQAAQPVIHAAAAAPQSRIVSDEPRTKGEIFADAVGGIIR